MRYLSLFCLLLCLLPGLVMAQTEHITNGSFETGNIVGWNTTVGGGATAVTSPSRPGGGSYVLRLLAGELWQSVGTIDGQVTLSAWGMDTTSPYGLRIRLTDEASCNWNFDSTVYDEWVQISGEVDVSGCGSLKIILDSQIAGSPLFLYFDDVSLVSVPEEEPETGLLTDSSIALIVATVSALVLCWFVLALTDWLGFTFRVTFRG